MVASDRVWVDNTEPDVFAADYNGFNNENKNLIASSGQPTNSADNNQTANAVSVYASKGDFYKEAVGSAADIYLLEQSDTQKSVFQLKDGMRIRFKVANQNTGNSTVNVNGIGVKAIKYSQTDLVAGMLQLNAFATLVFDESNDLFDLEFSLDDNALFIDKINKRVGVGTTGPLNSTLEVVAAVASMEIKSTTDANATFVIDAGENSDAVILLDDNNLTRWAVGMDSSNANVFTWANGGGLGSAQRMALETNGNLAIGTGSSNSQRCLIQGASSTESTLRVLNTNESTGSSIIQAFADRASDVAYSFFQCQSDANGTPDAEFNFRGDGNAFADGSFTGGGADYAEYFESSDGLAIGVGQTVVLENGKVRKALTGETPIGVVRPKSGSSSTVIGNNPWNHWKGKYVKTPFGDYKKEIVKYVRWDENVVENQEFQKTSTVEIPKEVIKEIDGKYVKSIEEVSVKKKLFKTVDLYDNQGEQIGTHEIPIIVKKNVVIDKAHKKYKVSDAQEQGITIPDDAEYFDNEEKILSAEYDPSLEYIPPEKRDEKIIVGLLGQMPVLNDQIVSDKWDKENAVDNNVDIYCISCK